jgi:type IV pilus assembly protein PilA
MLMVLKKQLKRSRKKGFTLVEVIVVLVILAILAAIAIPALTGYIDDANKKAVLSQTRSAVVAAQKIVSEEYGSGETSDNILQGKVTKAEIQRLTGDTSITSVGGILVTGSAIRKLSVEANGRTGIFENGKYSTK